MNDFIDRIDADCEDEDLKGIVGTLKGILGGVRARPLTAYQEAQVRQENAVRSYLFSEIRRHARPKAKLRRRLERLRAERAVHSDAGDTWRQIVRRDIPRAARLMQSSLQARVLNAKKAAIMCSREARRGMARTNRRLAVIAGPITYTIAARKQAREMLAFWRRNEREEREARKRAEKEAVERQRAEEETREARRQQRKLNFLLTQTELYGHFVGKKKLEPLSTPASTLSANADFADVDDATLREQAAVQAMHAVHATHSRLNEFDREASTIRGLQEEAQPGVVEQQVDALDFKSPSSATLSVAHQPRILQCQLKPYQLKGLSWLASLYEQGINGILADEMGLGKTVQAISLLAYLAETCNLWGPFLIITPASTLHNWQQELARFLPDFRVLPYWGSVVDRKTLRRFWDPRRLYARDSHFHVLVTSYQLVVADEKHFQRIKWQYMILDEAQAIKSSMSARWKTLLSFRCRNRLLLTGTPIQNSMQELWALLHFIMPGLFDSHDEFSDWFARDIESHAERHTGLDEHQLHRLHVILRPFMLRRVKKDVENELGDKIEIEIRCAMSSTQRALYTGLRQKLPVTSLVKTDLDGLMNLVMQFRKVCNHPELFERSQVESPFVVHRLGAVGGGGGDDRGIVRGPLANPLLENNHLVKRLRLFDNDSPAAATIRASPPALPAILKLDHARLGLEDELRERLAAMTHDSDAFRALARLHSLYIPRAVSFMPPLPSPCSTYLAEDRGRLPFEELCLVTRPLIVRPDFNAFINASGKLRALDDLLPRLKSGGHRVLVYNQMTRMIDLLEEYLQHRHHRYLRLDGATRIADRRDLVADWQSDDSIFIFLLSTRAGGLGINLTAADTVIFYDSDWNPTVDQQAMDRAHRLGQTRQVSVYRLVTKGTIEERILERAKQKHAIQAVVIAGADFKQQLGDEVEAEAEGGKEGDEKEIDSRLFVDEATKSKDREMMVSMLLKEEEEEDMPE